MRIRTIKPEFFLHVGLFELESESKLPIRLSFAGLWCAADRDGRFKWEPRKLKVQILPYDDIDFSRVLDALTTRGFLVKYASQGAEYGWIPSFTKHQVINNRERDSELPPPMEIPIHQGVDACLTRASRVVDACPTPLSLAQAEGKGREQGREGKGTSVRSGIPATEKEAIEWASMEAVPAPFAQDAYHQCNGRDWKDGAGQTITNWRSYVKSRFSRQQKAPSETVNGSSKPLTEWQINQRIKAKEERIASLRREYAREDDGQFLWPKSAALQKQECITLEGELSQLKTKLASMTV